MLVTKCQDEITSGLISETEAYLGAEDKASHAYGLKRTKRTEVMYAEGGMTYVYLCYGLHHLFNVVTGEKDDPQAVLIRAVIPLEGIEIMLKRRSTDQITNLCNGPGKLSKALGINLDFNGMVMPSAEIWIEDRGFEILEADVQVGARIGIDYAEEDALLPYRFSLRRNFPAQCFRNE